MILHQRNSAPQPQSASAPASTNAPPSSPSQHPDSLPEPNLPSPCPDLLPLSALLDPRFTLDQLADQFHTTIEAISLWMLQPDIQQRIEIIETASIQRARIAAQRALPAIATACHSILTTFNDPLRTKHLDPDDQAAGVQERRTAETARRAGALLLRIARFRRVSDTPVSGTAGASPASVGSPTPSVGASRASDRRNAAIVLDLINTPEFASALAAAIATPNSAAAAERVTEQIEVGAGVGVGGGASATPPPNPPSRSQDPKSAPPPAQRAAPGTQHSANPQSSPRSRDPTARAA